MNDITNDTLVLNRRDVRGHIDTLTSMLVSGKKGDVSDDNLRGQIGALKKIMDPNKWPPRSHKPPPITRIDGTREAEVISTGLYGGE